MRRSSRVFVAGLLMLLLGIGNLTIGTSKLDQYSRDMREALAEGGPEAARPFRGTASILESAPDARFRFESATIKYQYYRVVHRGGRVLTLVGAALVMGAIIRRILVPSAAGRPRAAA